MNANVAWAGSAQHPLSARRRAEDHIAASRFERPTLVLDIEAVASQYHALKAGLGQAAIHYAVKANPAREVVGRLVAEGSRFDCASRGEIELCLALGARPKHISFGNTVKKAADIAFAAAVGIRMFAADAEEELRKIAAHAPGAEIYLRLLVENSEADWPLTRKFGCTGEEALRLMRVATGLGLRPAGLSFHVGSQTRDPLMWRAPLDAVAEIWHRALRAGYELDLLNIGGGFPAFYGEDIPSPALYGSAVMDEVRARFGRVARVMAEPGRGLVAEAGAIACEVVLTAKKGSTDLVRWVFLDIGKFSGLAETIDEAIRYQFVTPHDGGPTGPCILAGPSCDSADVLYERRPVQLPLALKAGDRVIIRHAGAYTSSYASVGFNGFPPLDVRCI
ncbi:MAG TPA: type III PLP-dependent enzyme [Paracoccaceae bacterium]|nr:type III PLP-dependent enzyme [Paracoccaceae bacterium]